MNLLSIQFIRNPWEKCRIHKKSPIKGRMPSNQKTTWHYYEKVIISNAITYCALFLTVVSFTYLMNLVYTKFVTKSCLVLEHFKKEL